MEGGGMEGGGMEGGSMKGSARKKDAVEGDYVKEGAMKGVLWMEIPWRGFHEGGFHEREGGTVRKPPFWSTSGRYASYWNAFLLLVNVNVNDWTRMRPRWVLFTASERDAI